nr:MULTISPECIES: sensor histidine kinase [Lachnospiraceae]
MVIYLSGRITRPISDIRNAMKQIGKGNMEAEVPVSGEDEIGQLAATMNRMSKKIGELVERIRREETNQRLLELKAMQYQINPHFLYNTLDSISMFARKNHDEQCEELVIALSDFFRISLSHGQEFVTVEKEVKYAECYLEIQNIRFPEQITWDVTVEEELKEIKIMKFILQPLVENSIYHGIRDAGRKGHIQISAYQDANGLILCVQDDGIGMLPEELTELMADLESEEIREKDIHEGGFGLKNVHQRLKLMYGENSGLQIKSEWEEGTCITIYIPYKSGFSRQALDLSMDGDAS